MNDQEFIEFIKELLLAPDTVIKKAHMERMISILTALEAAGKKRDEQIELYLRTNKGHLNTILVLGKQIATLKGQCSNWKASALQNQQKIAALITSLEQKEFEGRQHLLAVGEVAIERDRLTAANTKLAEEIERLRKALEEIANPIEFMRKRLKEGEQLNGQYAVMLSQDHNFLKSIAKDAFKGEKEAEYESKSE